MRDMRVLSQSGVAWPRRRGARAADV